MLHRAVSRKLAAAKLALLKEEKHLTARLGRC